MSLRTDLPDLSARVKNAPKALSFDVPSTVTARFVDTPVMAADENDANTIHILDDIGYDFWTGGGVTAKTVKEALNEIGKKPVTVIINSPGGDLFEGIAIYNLLRMHPAEVTIRVIGLAASAASVIAMAGDRVEIGTGSFFMVHNAWVCACGNSNDLRAVAEYLEPFDAAIRDVYAARTSLDDAELSDLMDKESWLDAKSSIEKGFADAEISADLPQPVDNATRDDIMAKRAIDAALASQGRTRAERRKLIAQASGITPSADSARDMSGAVPPTAMRDAGEIAKAVQRGLSILNC